jgi:hypothetical protein
VVTATFARWGRFALWARWAFVRHALFRCPRCFRNLSRSGRCPDHGKVPERFPPGEGKP